MNVQLKIAGVLLAATTMMSAVAQAEKCVTREDQLYTAPRVEALVNKVGGMRNLEGQWKLGGIAGSFKKVLVSFLSQADGMKALVEGLDDVPNTWAFLTVCETQRADVVHVRIQNSKDSLYMRGVSTRKIELAQISNGKVGTFYPFDKIK